MLQEQEGEQGIITSTNVPGWALTTLNAPPSSDDADAGAPVPYFSHLVVDALAIISHSDLHFAVLVDNGNPALLRARMSKNVCKSLLNDTKNGRFQFRSESWKLRGLDVEKGLNLAASGQSIQVPS